MSDDMSLQPGPGLTVVTGRNGSGKSTFAEAVELALSGENSRWTDKQNNKALWQQGWRNLHADGPTEIAVQLYVPGRGGPTTVRMHWADDATLDQANWTVQRHGDKREPMSRGWLSRLGLYRPFLSYGELGAVVDKRPTELYAALHGVLGLGALDDARTRLKSARAPLDTRAKAVTETRKQLFADLAEVDDERARRAADLLRATRPDLDAFASLVLAEDADAEVVGDLRTLAALTVGQVTHQRCYVLPGLRERPRPGETRPHPGVQLGQCRRGPCTGYPGRRSRLWEFLRHNLMILRRLPS